MRTPRLHGRSSTRGRPGMPSANYPITIGLVQRDQRRRERIVAQLKKLRDLEVVVALPAPDPELLRQAKPKVVVLHTEAEHADALVIAERAKGALPKAEVILADIRPTFEEIHK